MQPDGVLIIGGGITGLSCAYHLGAGRVLEREGEVGGLCRTYRKDGFTFDFTGHLLHLRDPSVRELIEALAPGAFAVRRRRARIFSKGRFTEYPFQANLHGLPDAVIRECLEGLRRARANPPRGPAPSFRQWVLATFGEGIAHHFMFPYNRKLWRVPLSEVTAEWVEGLVPVPRLEDVEKGARGASMTAMGYNASFLYPDRGGIDVLARAFLPHVPRVHLNREVVGIDPELKKVECRGGESYRYESLVSTMPLPQLVRCLRAAPAWLAADAEKLRYTSIWDINLGIEGECPTDAHWVYFPEEEFPFYRVGFPGNFSADLVPPGHHSAYVEVAHRPDERLAAEAVLERSLRGLRRSGLLREAARVVLSDLVHIPFAYVVFDAHRRDRLPVIREYFRERGIHLAGRYGGWEYLSMEEAILAGRRAAREVSERHGS